MSEVLKIEIFYIELWHILALTISLHLNTIIFMKSKKSSLLYFFLYVQGNIILWFIAKILKTVSPTIELRWFFVVLQYIGISLLEVAFLEFAYVYAYQKTFSKKTRLIIYIFPIIQFAVVVTNPYHYFFYSKFTFYSDSFGILFYAYMAVEYTMFFIGIYWCSKRFGKMIAMKKKAHVWLVSSAILFPFIFNLIYITNILKAFFRFLGIKFVFDITPIAFTLSLFIFIFAIFSHEFIDIIPIMKEHILNYIKSAVIVLDKNNRIIAGNDTAKRVFNINNKKTLFYDIYYQSTGEVLPEDMDKIEQFTVKINYIEKARDVLIKNKKLYNNQGHRIGNLINLEDVTDIMLLKTIQEDKNKQIENSIHKLKNKIEILKETSRISARNFVARELHDVLGHTLTLTINLLETSRMYYKDNMEISKTGVREAINALKNGYTELRQSLKNKVRLKKDTVTVLADIRALANVFSNAKMSVKVHSTGDNRILSPKEYTGIRRICQEALTNSLKHGKATEVFVSIRFNDGKTSIHIVDNGMGCGKIVKNTGLQSMETRIKELNGVFSFSSEPESGFIIFAQF